MSAASKWIMALIVGAIVIGLAKNASGTTGIILAGGAAGSGVLGTLEGTTSTQKGSFSQGSTKIAYS